ncbi:alpha/beta hydrolase [Rhodoferax sp. TH121]|uniref:alpha/beta fold hydrolase n=1 Tax=Rhodoferax sp. TH121 TaxID=2022803 RepID=UPI000B9791A3|nr:alpha/beta fold hydrolase [Rhodoferax sp. TH121]OYQ39761.1 alpha/beta hydrolase [Rhodoferax sp. TH121]
MKVTANGISIEVEDSAQTDASFANKPAVLLIMGLGMQLIAWPPEMVRALEAAGYRVVRFDNRDAGLSSHFDALGKPNLLWASIKYKLGLVPAAPYTLSDMAADAIGVLDALKIEKAHVLGVSMGGMIAQRVALAAPNRTLSLTSIMSTSGARGLPQAAPEVVRALISRPAGKGTDAVVDQSVRLFQTIGSPGYPTPEPELRERVRASVLRAFHPVGTARQMLAVLTDITRAALLGRITAPTLVVHGKEDPLVPLACGEDTARRIPGATLLTIDGMGHDLPPEPVRQILAALIPHLKASA